MFFDEDWLLESVKAKLGSPVQEIQDTLLADVQKFVGDTSQSDDIALIVLFRDASSVRSMQD